MTNSPPSLVKFQAIYLKMAYYCFRYVRGYTCDFSNIFRVYTDLFLYSYEADFIQGLLKKNEKKLDRSFNFTFRYIDDVLSLNNSTFGDFVDRIYPIELKIKDTTYTYRSASFLDLHLEIDSEGRVKNETLRQKR